MPEDGFVAALEDEDFSSALGHSAASEDVEFEPLSDGRNGDASSSCSNPQALSASVSARDSEEENVHWSSDGESGNQSEDGQSQVRSQ